MEVHHHTASPGKKWTHYLWEFLMLFLAVFCGFLAENFREKQVENHREKQFIRSLYNDIKGDTANLSRIIANRTAREADLDSTFELLNGSATKEHTGQIYMHAITISRTLVYRFVPNDGTMQQLKNAGGMRLIRKNEVVDSITRYDATIRNLMSNFMVEENVVEYYRTAASKIFHARFFDEMLDQNSNVVRKPIGNPPLQPFTDRELYEWNYRLYSLKSINNGNRRETRSILNQAVNLLNLLKQSYHLE
jgi:hypothetical protein